MKIYNITIHNVPNFGSVLQTLATQLLFTERGIDYSTIDYYQPRDLLKNRIKSVLINSKAPIVKRISMFITMDLLNKHIFSSFLKRRIKLTKRVISLAEIMQLPIADIYMTGSDQVWNSIHNKFINTTYYYEGIKAPKVAFASSFGRSELPTQELNKIKPLLYDYEMISVREDTGINIINSILPNKKIEQILDPTLLIEANTWKKFQTNSSDTHKRYILIYPMSNMDNRLFEIARKVSTQIGNCEVWLLSPGLKKYNQCDKTLCFQSPERFLELIDNALCVITNSFHGTAFSINFKTPFISLMPEYFSTRLQSLLELTNFTNRIWNEKFNYSDVMNIDFKESHNILMKERIKANKFIDKILKNEK